MENQKVRNRIHIKVIQQKGQDIFLKAFGVKHVNQLSKMVYQFLKKHIKLRVKKTKLKRKWNMLWYLKHLEKYALQKFLIKLIHCLLIIINKFHAKLLEKNGIKK